jgi:hypothetical protein
MCAPQHARAYFEMGVVLQLLFRKEPDVKKQLAMLQKNVELNEQAVKLKPGSWEDLLGPGYVNLILCNFGRYI